MRRQGLQPAGPAPATTPAGTDRCRGHVPESDLHQMVRRLQQEDRRPDQLPVDRLGRRHPPVHRGHGGFRRHRRADERRADRGRQGQGAARAHGARRGGGDVQPARAWATPSSSSTARPSPTSSWGGSPSGTTKRIAALNPGREAARPRHHRGAPLGRVGHQLHLHRLPQQGVAASGRKRSATPPR